MLVDRCWICLEQPAVTTVPGADGKDVPACDICAAEHALKAPVPDVDQVSDDEWARIVQDLE